MRNCGLKNNFQKVVAARREVLRRKLLSQPVLDGNKLVTEKGCYIRGCSIGTAYYFCKRNSRMCYFEISAC